MNGVMTLAGLGRGLLRLDDEMQPGPGGPAPTPFDPAIFTPEFYAQPSQASAYHQLVAQTAPLGLGTARFPADAPARPQPVGPPLQITPEPVQAPAPQPQQQPQPQPQPSTWIDRLGTGLNDNASMLMGLGAGIAQGGIGKGLQMGAQFGSLDTAAKRQQRVYDAVLRATNDPLRAQIAAAGRRSALPKHLGSTPPVRIREGQ
jgi:hypothetical protein